MFGDSEKSFSSLRRSRKEIFQVDPTIKLQLALYQQISVLACRVRLVSQRSSAVAVVPDEIVRPARNQAPQPMIKRTKILLIDDDLMVRQALGQVLTAENYQVVPAANRHEALHEVGQQPIDIVLLDLNPRTESGWETLQRLTALQPHLPVVAMTARPEHESNSSRAQAVHALLEKPLSLSILLQVLNELASQTPTPRRCSHTSDRSQ
jgi:CheY-like chemotaxis protein